MVNKYGNGLAQKEINIMPHIFIVEIMEHKNISKFYWVGSTIPFL